MAESVVAICNRALDYLGQSPITSLEDGSTAARIMSRQYATSRDVVLRSYPWNCAMARASLAALVEAPAWGFLKQYQLPVDCLRVVEIDGDVDSRIQWRVEGRRLLCDEAGPLNIRYLRQIADPTEIDAMCGDAIAARLAADTARSITGSTSDVEMMMARLRMIMDEARATDGREQSQDDGIVADDWLAARYSWRG